MFDFIPKVAFGALVFIFGLRLFFKPKWYAFLRSYHFDFTDHHHIWGVVWMLIGILFLWIVIRQKIRSNKKGGKRATDP